MHLQLHLAALFSTQLHTLNQKKHRISFHRIDKTHQLQIIPGKLTVNFNRPQPDRLRVLPLITYLSGRNTVLFGNLAQFFRDR